MSEVKVELPDLRTVARHAAPRIVEGTVVPLVIFAVGLRLVGVWGSMIVGLAWVYGAVLTRLVRRRPVPGVLLIGAASLTARTLIALWSHSVVVYFLQPSLGTMLVAGAFLVCVGRALLAALVALTLARPSAARVTSAPTPSVSLAGSTVAVIGDYGVDTTAEANVASLVASWGPAAIVTVGDNYYTSGGSGTGKYDLVVGKYYCAFLKGAASGTN